MLPLAYFAQINLREFCLQAFPGISEQAISDLTAGVELMQFRPDEELKRLAARAVELGLGRRGARRRRPRGDARRRSAASRRARVGRRVRAPRATRGSTSRWGPASSTTSGPGSTTSRSRGPRSPATSTRIERGEDARRARATELLDRARSADRRVPRAAAVGRRPRHLRREPRRSRASSAPHLQDHNFYIEHRHHTVFWNKMRALADRMVAAGVLAERDDLFYLNRWEVGQALYDARLRMGAGRARRATRTGSDRRAAQGDRDGAARRGSPSPRSGRCPPTSAASSAPQFGITPERGRALAGRRRGRPDELRGVPASPRRAEGPARVVLSPAQIPEVGTGEILVCPATAPAWAPVFAHVGAVVSDVGGTMSHAAILCREYGIPAVLGTGHAHAPGRDRRPPARRRRRRGRDDPRAGARDLSRAMAHVLDLADAASEPVDRVGGKAAGLARLVALGHAVPAGLRGHHRRAPRLDASAGRRGAGRPPGRRSTATTARGVAASEAIAALFAGGGARGRGDRPRLPPRRRRRRRGGGDPLQRHRRGPERRVVRGPAGDLPLGSSAATPCAATSSRCWASLYSPQAIEYRRRLAIPADDVAMAVVVQRLVAAEAAGVLFTIDPLTGDPSQIAIEATFGLGLPIVGGEVTPDRYGVDKVTFEVRARSIASKPFADRFDPATGAIQRVALDAAAASAPCLSDDEVIALATLGKRVEHAFGHAMDIEWAVGPGPAGPRAGAPAAGAARDGGLEPHTRGRRRRAARRDGSHRLGDARNTAPKESAMKRSDDRILTTHVGSLARSHELLDAMRARDQNGHYDDADLRGARRRRGLRRRRTPGRVRHRRRDRRRAGQARLPAVPLRAPRRVRDARGPAADAALVAARDRHVPRVLRAVHAEVLGRAPARPRPTSWSARPGELPRAGCGPARHRHLRGRRRRARGRRGVPPRRLPDGLRAQRVLRHRGRVHGRGGRGAARGVPGDRRRRADPARSTTRGSSSCSWRIRRCAPEAAPRRARRARRAHQPRAARDPARAGAPAHVLRAQPRPAPARRGLRRRRRLHARRSTPAPTRSRSATRATSTSGASGRPRACPRARSSCPGSSATRTTSSSTRS